MRLRVPPISSTHSYVPIFSLPNHRPPSQSLGKKIWRVCQRLFQSLANILHKTSFLGLSKRQIRLVKQVRQVRERSSSLAARVAVIKPPSALEEILAEIKVANHDPSLEQLKEFLQNFTQIAVNECLYEDALAPHFPNWKQSLKGWIESIPDWNATLIALKEPLMPLMDNLRRADDPALTLTLQLLLRHYVQSDRETVKAELLERLQERKDSGSLSETKYHKAVAYLDPVLKWLYHPNNWMVRSEQPMNLHHFFSDSFRFLEALLTYIEDGKLKNSLDAFKNFIETDFEEEIRSFLLQNTLPVTSLLANRLSDMIERLPYADTYKHILGKIVEQMEGWMAADQAKAEQIKLIKDAKEANNTRATNAQNIENQRTAKSLLDVVAEDGGEDNFLLNEFRRAFGKHRACHPQTKNILISESQDELLQIRKKTYEEIVESLMPIFLSRKTKVLPFGLEIDVNGIFDLIDRLEMPKKIHFLKNTALFDFKVLLDSSRVVDKENFRAYFFGFIHMIASEYMQMEIKKVLVKQLEKFVSRLSSPEYLDYLASAYIFPSLIEKMVEGFIRSYLSRQSKETAQAFCEIFIQDLSIQADDLPFLNQLYKSIQTSFLDFNLDEAGISEDEFKRIARPVLQDMYRFITKNCGEEEPLTQDLLVKVLAKYSKMEKVSVNADYGKLIAHMLFDIGSYGGWFLKGAVGWLQGSISEMTSQTLYQASQHYQVLISSVVATAKDRLLSAQAIRQNLFADELCPEQKARQKEDVQRHLPAQTRRIAALAHDSIYRALEANPIPFVQRVTPKTEDLVAVIQNVYRRMFSDEMLNESLMLSCIDEIRKSFEKAMLAPQT